MTVDRDPSPPAGRARLTDAMVLEASRRLARGERQRAVAAAYGVTARALRSRFRRLGVSGGTRGRPKVERAQHCPTCRCDAAPSDGGRGREREGQGDGL